MANDKVELWVEAFSAALDAKAEMGFIYLDNGMIVEELYRHAAPVLAEKDAEIARLTEVNAHLTVCVANLEQLPRYILARFRSGKLHNMAYGLRNYKLEADDE